MMIDYLRFVAFTGSLRGFFLEGVNKYVPPEYVTGLHLRFDPDFFGIDFYDLLHEYHWTSDSGFSALNRYRNRMGIELSKDSLFANPPIFNEGIEPFTFKYKERNDVNLHLQIIIDVHPEHWRESYEESGYYNEVRIIYRKSGPAIPNSPIRVFDKTRSNNFGTICGYFKSKNGTWYALTCAHVVNNAPFLYMKQNIKFWKWPMWSVTRKLGPVIHSRSFSLARRPFNTQNDIDAALIKSDPVLFPKPPVIYEAMIKPIANIVQEEPILFYGGSKFFPRLAKVAAITIKKSMDLLKNGQLHDVGDVLMIGHLHKMYVMQLVSKPGDSGASVQQSRDISGSFYRPNEWYGMILGGDEQGSYACYSEHLYGWAQNRLSDRNLEFYFCP